MWYKYTPATGAGTNMAPATGAGINIAPATGAGANQILRVCGKGFCTPYNFVRD